MVDAGSYNIRFIRGCLVGTMHPLHEGEATIGRSSSNSIVVPDITMSRAHARLVLSGSRLVIEDRNSKAGTFVNGRRVLVPANLQPGDQIELGSQVVEILSAHSPPTREIERSSGGCVEKDGAEGLYKPTGHRARGRYGSGRIGETVASVASISALLASGLLLLEVTGARFPFQTREPALIIPAGWSVTSQFVDIGNDGRTNEIVLVLRSSEGPP